jgi:hypothetical protein
MHFFRARYSCIRCTSIDSCLDAIVTGISSDAFPTDASLDVTQTTTSFDSFAIYTFPCISFKHVCGFIPCCHCLRYISSRLTSLDAFLPNSSVDAKTRLQIPSYIHIAKCICFAHIVRCIPFKVYRFPSIDIDSIHV